MNHTFHIPVLGLGYSIDTPLKVARYGISSVVSIVDDELTERMRKYHQENTTGGYTLIEKKEEDSRARRITAYLNLLDVLVKEQFTALQTQTSNPLTEKEEFDITVTNIKHDDIKISLTIDGLKNSTVIPGNPPNVITPTSKVVIFKFNRHEGASTPAVLPIKLGDEYTACIAFAANEKNGSCLRAGVDSITQPQKKSLDVNYIPF